MSGTGQADDDCGEPCAVLTQRLGKEGQQREESEYQHGFHSARIGFHAFFLNKQFGQITAAYAYHGHNQIKYKDKQDGLLGV